jgi:prevent-host-death family protein
VEKFNIHEAKTQLSRLLESAAAGEEIIIAKAGKPVARLVGIEHRAAPRRKGLLKGMVKIHDDFYKPLPEEVIAVFEGKPPG